MARYFLKPLVPSNAQRISKRREVLLV